MDTDAHEWESDLTEAVIGAAFEVANVRGAGFLEKVYERALIRELALRASPRGLRFHSLSFTKDTLAFYTADLVACGKLIIELKCVERFAYEHLARCINYLKTSGLSVALLINFPKPRLE